MKTFTKFLNEAEEMYDNNDSDVSALSEGAFFGSLQESVVIVWQAHLKTDSYAVHMATNEFYEGMLDKVDSLIETYQGEHDKVDMYTNIVKMQSDDLIQYLENLQAITEKGREAFCDSSALESCCDDVLGLISTTLYKLKELS